MPDIFDRVTNLIDRSPRWIWPLILAVLLVAFFALPAFAGSVQPPDRLTSQFCASRVMVDGQVIASLRWEKGMDKAEVLAIPYADEAPDWYRALIDGWIEDAYAWQQSPATWLGKIMNQCNSISDS